MDDPLSKYHFVEFASRKQPGFRNKVVSIEQVPGLIDTYRAFDCSTTWRIFTDDFLNYSVNNKVAGKPSISGYNGDSYAYYLPIDIDAPELDKAREATSWALDALHDDLNLHRQGVQLYFSGNKGYHLMIDSRTMGVKPSDRLHLYFAEFRKWLADMMGEYGQSIDQQIKDPVRLWRLPNTIHAKSGLYKIRITEQDFRDLSTKEIKQMAKYPQSLRGTDRTGLLPDYEICPSNEAKIQYDHFVKNVNCSLEKRKSRMYCSKYPLKSHAGICKAKHAILTSGIEEGDRNNCALILASMFRENGSDLEHTRILLSNWDKRNSIGLSDWEINNVVKSAFKNPTPYKFGCSSLERYCPYENRKRCDYLNNKKSNSEE